MIVNMKNTSNVTISEVPVSKIKDVANQLYNKKRLPLLMITATDERVDEKCFKIWYLFGVPKKNIFIANFIRLTNTNKFPSITSIVNEAWNYERKIKSFFGLIPEGHPDERPIILHENWPTNIFPLRKDFDPSKKIPTTKGEYKFQKVAGEGIYEIPVGPIHAGIIEPGHFRFSVAGEEIVNLEAKLGFVHKGSEKLFESLPIDKKIELSEKISGDSSFSHSLAFCQAVESLGEVLPSKRALYLRVIFAELERLANHIGDIGAIMGDTGFNFGQAQASRIREQIMQINERLTESRFLRGTNIIGGVTKDIKNGQKKILSDELQKIAQDFMEIIDIAENNVSLLNRLKGTGMISKEFALYYGALGIASRADGIEKDARVDFPYARYGELADQEIKIEKTGDVYSRYRVRVREVISSIKIIQKALKKLPAGEIGKINKNIKLKKNSIAFGIVEGWRGEIVYFITTDKNGNISRVAPRDPSFINWSLLGNAGLGDVVPDFPLINKSFNLSYSGNDL